MSIFDKIQGFAEKWTPGPINNINNRLTGQSTKGGGGSYGGGSFPTYPEYQQGYTPSQFQEGEVAQRNAQVGQGLEQEVQQQQSGDSPYSRLRMSRADQQAQAQGAGEMSALAAKGGLRSGAAERVADRTAQNSLAMRENIGADEQNLRSGNIRDLASLQMNKNAAQTQAGQYDRSAYQRAAENYNNAQLSQYQTQGALMGSEANAYATANSGKK